MVNIICMKEIIYRRDYLIDVHLYLKCRGNKTTNHFKSNDFFRENFQERIKELMMC